MVSLEPRRFVVQHHVISTGCHWDLMLETGDSLATWQLPVPPKVVAASPATARRIEDHRKLYLDYEGPVSGNRGHVSIADAGTFCLLIETDDLWRVDLAGRILRGRYELARDAHSPDGWVFRPLAG